MKETEARTLRNLIIENFKSAPSLDQLTANLKVKTVEDWALSVEEVMELNPDKPEQFYMRQEYTWRINDRSEIIKPSG